MKCKCETCGSLVTVSTASEGTAFYEPIVSPERLAAVRAEVGETWNILREGAANLHMVNMRTARAQDAVGRARVLLDALLEAPK